LKGLQLRAPTSDDGDESRKGLVGWKREADFQSLKVFIQDAIQDCKHIWGMFQTRKVLHFSAGKILFI